MTTIGRILFTKIKPLHLLPIASQFRASSFKSSPFLSDLKATNAHTVQYDKTQCPIDWSYVQRTLPPDLVPNPTPKAVYSSGWKPSSIEDATKLPYYIERTKNHMVPVYLYVNRLGIRRVTKIKRIRGDIWKLHDELERFLQKHQVRPIRTQVNELTGSIQFYGDWVNAIKHWLEKRGF